MYKKSYHFRTCKRCKGAFRTSVKSGRICDGCNKLNNLGYGLTREERFKRRDKLFGAKSENP